MTATRTFHLTLGGRRQDFGEALDACRKLQGRAAEGRSEGMTCDYDPARKVWVVTVPADLIDHPDAAPIDILDEWGCFGSIYRCATYPPHCRSVEVTEAAA